MRFDIEPEQEAGPQLRALGIGATDVRRVVLTHLHIDHDGGLGHSRRAKFWSVPASSGLRPALWAGFAAICRSAGRRIFDPQPLVLDGGAYGPFPRSKRLTGDGAVVAVATPGHTPDHLSVIVEDGDAAVFIAGDASYSEATMLAGAIDGVSEDEAQAAATLAPFGRSPRRRRRSICPRTIPTLRAARRTAC